MPEVSALEMLKWEKRSIVLSAFGLVGFGAVVGAGTVYWLYMKQKIELLFQIQSVIIQDIQIDVDKLKKSIESIKTSPGTSNQSIHDDLRTSDEEAYVTAGSSSESENENDNDELDKVRFKKKRSSIINKGETVEADQVANFLDNIDKLLEGGMSDQHEAFNTLKINKDKLKNSCDFWWRLAKATHLEASIAASNGDKDLRKSHIETAFTYAEKALKLDDSSSDAHKWFAITVGSRSEYFSLSDRIKSGYTFKEHVDRAVELNPRDSGCYHLLGRFCLEVSQLTWIERKVASTLFSNPPTATAKEALANFQESEKIKPFKENRLFIAKCYITMGESKDAAKWLDIAFQMPVLSGSDKVIQVEIVQLLQKYRKYLS